MESRMESEIERVMKREDGLKKEKRNGKKERKMEREGREEYK